MASSGVTTLLFFWIMLIRTHSVPINVKNTCGCVETSSLHANNPLAWTFLDRQPGDPDFHQRLKSSCDNYCESKLHLGRSEHFILEQFRMTTNERRGRKEDEEDRFLCKCYSDLKPFDCDEESEGIQLVQVHCKLKPEERRAEAEAHHHTDHSMNYYHQLNTMAAVRHFNAMVDRQQQQSETSTDDGNGGRHSLNFFQDRTSTTAPESEAAASSIKRHHVTSSSEAEVQSTSSRNENEAVAISAAVLSLFAVLLITYLAIKTWCDHRKERIKAEKAERASVESTTTTSSLSSQPPRRERLRSFSAGPWVYEKK